MVIDKFHKLKILFEEWRDLPRESYMINNDKLYKEIKDAWDSYCHLRDDIIEEYGPEVFMNLSKVPKVRH